MGTSWIRATQILTRLRGISVDLTVFQVRELGRPPPGGLWTTPLSTRYYIYAYAYMAIGHM